MEESVQQNSEVQEVAPLEKAETHEVQAAQQQQAEDRQEKNWRAMRERQRELESELRKERELREQAMSFVMQNTQKPQQEVDELDQISDDEFIPKGKVKQLVEKKAAKIAQEIAQKETEKLIRERESSQFLDKLKRKFSDFDDVVNPETLSILEQNEPELAQSIADLKDPYKMGIQSYKYIKALNLSEKASETRHKKEVEQKLEKNSKTVQSPQVFEKRPMAQAFKVTKAEYAKLYEEMMENAGRAGFGY